MEVKSKGRRIVSNLSLNLKDYYVGITFQFIDDDWKLWNLPVGFPQIIGPHTNIAVGTLIAETIRPFLGAISSLFVKLLTRSGPGRKPFGAVIDGGDIGCAKYVGEAFECEKDWFKDETCVCHQVNNAVKHVLSQPEITDVFLVPWRKFVKRLRKSHPFAELWEKSCLEVLKKEVILQPDTPTRWSSAVAMMTKAVSVKEVVVELAHRVRDMPKHLVCNSNSSSS